jgi:hypothetical protein
MKKLLAVGAATFLAVTAIASGAEAGFNVRLKAPAEFSEVLKAGCGGAHRVVSHTVRRSKPRAAAASRAPSKKVVVSSAVPEAPSAADVEEEKANIAQFENSSITTDKQVAAIAAPKTEKSVSAKPSKVEQKVAASGGKDCKKFFPSVGMTLSVACDAN